MDQIYALMRAYGLTAEQAAEVLAQQDREQKAKALVSGEPKRIPISDVPVVPQRIPLEQVPLASHTVMTKPDYEPAQWAMVRATVGPEGAREQWERPIPEGTSEVRMVDRPAGVSRRAVQTEDGEWIEPRPATVKVPPAVVRIK